MAPHYSLLCFLSFLIYYSPLYFFMLLLCGRSQVIYTVCHILDFFSFLPHGLWDLSSSARDPTPSPLKWKQGQSLNHWTTRDLVDFITVIHVQFSRSVVSNSATPWITARQASLSITNSWSSLGLMSIESVMPSSHLILCHPLLLLPQSSQHQSLSQWVNSWHEVAKVLEFQL